MPPLQDLVVAGRLVGMGADDEAGAAVDEMREAHLLRGRLGMEVDDHRVGLLAERTGGELALAARNGSSSSGCMNTRPMMLATRTRAPVLAI